LEAHIGELPVLEAAAQSAQMFGMVYSDPSPLPAKFLDHHDWVHFGNTRLQVLFTPGHSPASVSFWCPEHQFIIAGDVLFQGSIGRTDLPGGNFHTLITSIREQFFPLGDEVAVWPGHGPQTSIGFEKAHNPFLNGSYSE
jgi:glyoxylase-like metal-dependent hydrolase (beta-lactamase superfamily II)